MIGTAGPRVLSRQLTTRNRGAAYPFIAEASLGQRGVVIGDDLLREEPATNSCGWRDSNPRHSVPKTDALFR